MLLLVLDGSCSCLSRLCYSPAVVAQPAMPSGLCVCVIRFFAFTADTVTPELLSSPVVDLCRRKTKRPVIGSARQDARDLTLQNIRKRQDHVLLHVFGCVEAHKL